jgi:hypothetical protein
LLRRAPFFPLAVILRRKSTRKRTPHDNRHLLAPNDAAAHGHVPLDLPLGHKISVGDEFVLEGDVESLVEINEVAARGLLKAIAGPVPKTPPGLTPPPKLKL